MRRIFHMTMSLFAGLIVLLGLLFIFLPGPAIIILPPGIWLFNKYQPGKLDPYLRKFMRFNQRAATFLDGLFKK